MKIRSEAGGYWVVEGELPIIGICKNALTTMRKHFRHEETVRHVGIRGCPERAVVVIRQPWERYVSGVAEWSKTKTILLRTVVRDLEKEMSPDAHTTPQHELLRPFLGLTHLELVSMEAAARRFGLTEKLNQTSMGLKNDVASLLSDLPLNWADAWRERFAPDFLLYAAARAK